MCCAAFEPVSPHVASLLWMRQYIYPSTWNSLYLQIPYIFNVYPWNRTLFYFLVSLSFVSSGYIDLYFIQLIFSNPFTIP